MEDSFLKKDFACCLEELSFVSNKLRNFTESSQEIGHELLVDFIEKMRSATLSFSNQLEEYLKKLNDVENHSNMDSANSIFVADENIV